MNTDNKKVGDIMKENKNCFNCLYCKPHNGKYTCSYFTHKVELPIPFETCCEYFKCFQCTKHNKKYCWCYSDIVIKDGDIIVDVNRPEGWKWIDGDNENNEKRVVTITHKPTGIKVSNSQEKSQLKNYAKCIEDLKILLEENGYE